MLLSNFGTIASFGLNAKGIFFFLGIKHMMSKQTVKSYVCTPRQAQTLSQKVTIIDLLNSFYEEKKKNLL